MAALAAALVLLGLGAPPRSASAGTAWGPVATSATSKGMAALDAAAQRGKYLFIFFWRADDQQTRTMYGVFQTAMAGLDRSADSIGIPVADPKEKPLVDKFGLSRAPMPLVLALAPNGAVTKAFPVRFNGEQLRQAFVSPCAAQCLKALQARKIVVLCAENARTQFAQVALQGARDFKADPRFAAATEIVTLDPADPIETTFARSLRIDPRTPAAVTVLLAPPGRTVAWFAGAVTKDQIVAKVTAAQSGCCAGGKCGPGGCSPQ